MKILKAVIIVGTALAVSSPAFAGRDQVQIMQQEQAMKRKQEQAMERNQAEKGLAGPVGEQGKVGPGTKSGPRNYNIGHPTERVRR